MKEMQEMKMEELLALRSKLNTLLDLQYKTIQTEFLIGDNDERLH